MDAFMLYIDDWLSSARIQAMDAYEERGYLRLLMRAAKSDNCALPDDDAQLAIISMLGKQWYRPTKEADRRFGSMTSGQKLRECFEARGGFLFNKRLSKEWERQKEYHERRSIAGRAGNDARWGGKDRIAIANGSLGDPQAIANGSQEASQTPSQNHRTPTPTPNTKTLSRSSNAEFEAWFAEFWGLYPRRKGKGAARKAAEKRGKTPEQRAKILAALRSQLPELAAKEQQFIPFPATWLNGERYEDEPESKVATSQPELPLVRAPKDFVA